MIDSRTELSLPIRVGDNGPCPKYSRREKSVQMIVLHTANTRTQYFWTLRISTQVINHFSYSLSCEFRESLVGILLLIFGGNYLYCATDDVRTMYYVNVVRIRVYIICACMYTGTWKFKVGGNRSRCHNVLNISMWWWGLGVVLQSRHATASTVSAAAYTRGCTMYIRIYLYIYI